MYNEAMRKNSCIKHFMIFDEALFFLPHCSFVLGYFDRFAQGYLNFLPTTCIKIIIERTQDRKEKSFVS